MLKRSWAGVGFCFVTGAFAMFLRWLQLRRCLDTETGLFETSGALTLLFVVLAAVTAAGLLILAQPLRGKDVLSGESALRARSVIPAALAALCAVILLLGAVGVLFSAQTLLRRLLGLGGILAAAAGFGLARQLMQGKPDALCCACGAVMILFYCLWLIADYKDHASDPVIWGYAPEILAIAAGTLAFYYVSGFAFGKAKPYQSYVFAGLCFPLSLMTVPESHSFGEHLLFLGPALLLLLCVWLLGENMPKQKSET